MTPSTPLHSFAATVLVILLSLLVCKAHAADAEPQDIVKSTSTTLFETLANKREAFKQDPEQLNQFVKSTMSQTFDDLYSARLVLGRHARGATAEQVTAFAEALTDNLLRRYGKSLLEVEPSTEVKVLGETPLRGGQIIRVRSEVGRKAGAAIPIDYLFHQDKNGAWKAFDVIVEGVSYVQTFRNQFDEKLRQSDIDSVTASLRQENP